MKTLNEKMNNVINIDEFLILLYWIKTFVYIEGKDFKYDKLLIHIEYYKINSLSFDISMYNVDELVIDGFKIYDRLKKTEDKLVSLINSLSNSFIGKELIISESKKYMNIFERLMENYKYEDIEAKSIQKGFLIEKMNEYVKTEEYEQAAKLRDIINSIFVLFSFIR
jgi:hypothetical protein